MLNEVSLYLVSITPKYYIESMIFTTVPLKRLNRLTKLNKTKDEIRPYLGGKFRLYLPTQGVDIFFLYLY